MERSYAIRTSRLWLHGVAHQGDRLLKEMESDRPPSGATPEEFFAWARSRPKQSQLAIVEEHFFVIAVGKSIDWLNLVKEYEPSLSPEIEKYVSSLPDARTIRNMREHDDKYFLGKGHKQSEYVKTLPMGSNPSAIAVDGSSSLILDGVYQIGGRLNVGRAVELAREMLEVIGA